LVGCGPSLPFFLEPFAPVRLSLHSAVGTIKMEARVRELERENAALRAELAAQEKEKARLVVSHGLVGLGMWDLDIVNDNLVWNQSVFNIFEIEQQGFKGNFKAFLEAVHPKDRAEVDAAYTEHLRTRQPYEIVHRLLFPDGRVKWVLETCRTEFDGDTPLMSIGTVMDVTRLHETEDELRRALAASQEQGRARLQFLSKISHELRTPLHGIIGTLSQLGDEKQLSDEGREGLEICTTSGDWLVSLIDDILDLNSLDQAKMTLKPYSFNFSSTIKAIASLHRHRGVPIEVLARDEVDAVVADATRISQILQNLVGNAVKATACRPHGSIAIEYGFCDTKKSPNPDRSRGGRRLSDCTSSELRIRSVFVEVADTGIGIPKESWEAIFQLGRSDFRPPHFDETDVNQVKSSGMGLTVVRELARLMGGDVWVKHSSQEPGSSGSVFRLEVDVQTSLVRIPHHLEQSKQLKVLVVDDNPVNLRIIKHMLMPDHSVTCLSCGTKALDALGVPEWVRDIDNGSELQLDSAQLDELAKSPAPKFEAILCDYRMPDLDGREVLAILRRFERLRDHARREAKLEPLQAIPFALVSANVFADGSASSTNFFLSKPFTRAQLQSLLLNMTCSDEPRSASR
jgi:PAS domain S-box-containing protein